MSESDSSCIDAHGLDTHLHLRIASVFIILACATTGTLFPVLARRSKWLHVPKFVFDFAKYFGSGVIIATAFIHLLAPALEALSSPCLSPAWAEYPYALALCLLSIFSIFIVELVAFRWGTAKLDSIGLRHDPHGHHTGSHAAHGPEGTQTPPSDVEEALQKPQQHHHHLGDSASAQIVGIAILEFGVLLHSVLIGLTLAVDEKFRILFIVIVFHQTFEGLGLGSRLAFIKLPPKYNWVPILAACVFGVSTPVGIAVGLAVRSSYDPGSATASIVSGILDSLSAGILIYTGLVELLAHEFLFSKEMMNSSNGNLVYAIGTMLLGCGLMALLGKWA
ncbi:ZIP-like iron-zinc transporter [Mycena indigotica]|uniref:ZIP-like iron-zinc transporter n=1 Tax=Mycena indigotica TaxID=2126181 RepID=A0A8H6T4F2_9AGAR|nr:ZIP-like iron-zinc transporter [Mycena indigotica]KAF7310046.1 ZIP-like iron-zinc transporter [Mycena indigotica]